MRSRTWSSRALPLVLVAVLVAGCAPKDEGAAARQAIEAIDAAIASAGEQATKYVPGQAAAVAGQSTRLKLLYFDRDYQGILDAAPAVLERAQGLAATAAAKKAEIARVLDGEWTNLVTEVPEAIARSEKYVDEMLASKTVPPGVSREMLDAAKIGIAEQKTLWEKALAAKAAGDLEQAVTIGVHNKRRLENLIAALGGRNAG
jgi:hypothetical protein